MGKSTRPTPKVVKTKKPSKPAATQHRPAPRKVNPAKPTKLQRQGEAAIHDADRPAKRKDSGGRKRKSLASRTTNKIGRRHKIIRPVVYLTVGAAVVLAKATKVTAVGTGKAGKWGGTRLAAKVNADMHRRKWVPEATRPSNMPRFSRFTQLSCACGKTCSSVESLNRHLAEKHRGEERQYAKVQPKIRRGHTRGTAGKVIVRPEGAGTGAGRHRARHNLPSFQRVDAIIAAHRVHLTKIGEAAMATNNAAGALKRAAMELGSAPKPDDLAELAELCTGMERSFGAYSDSVSDWARMLMREADPGDRRGANIDSALVRPFERAIKEHLDQAGREFTRFVAAFHEFYRPEILAARKKKNPNIDLSKTG